MNETIIEEIERNERIAKDIVFRLEFLREKILEADKYVDEVLYTAQQLTHTECEYRFDEYPYVFSQKIFEDGSYISYEDAIDEIKCGNRVIYVENERVSLQIGKIDLILILKVRKVEVKKRE